MSSKPIAWPKGVLNTVSVTPEHLSGRSNVCVTIKTNNNGLLRELRPVLPTTTNAKEKQPNKSEGTSKSDPPTVGSPSGASTSQAPVSVDTLLGVTANQLRASFGITTKEGKNAKKKRIRRLEQEALLVAQTEAKSQKPVARLTKATNKQIASTSRVSSRRASANRPILPVHSPPFLGVTVAQLRANYGVTTTEGKNAKKKRLRRLEQEALRADQRKSHPPEAHCSRATDEPSASVQHPVDSRSKDFSSPADNSNWIELSTNTDPILGADVEYPAIEGKKAAENRSERRFAQEALQVATTKLIESGEHRRDDHNMNAYKKLVSQEMVHQPQFPPILGPRHSKL